MSLRDRRSVGLRAAAALTAVLGIVAVDAPAQAGPVDTGTSTVLAAPADGGATTLYGGFENGNTTKWSDSDGVTVSSLFARAGDVGARAVTTPLQGGYLCWDDSDVAQGRRYARIRGWVQVASALPGQSVGVLSVKNAAGEHHFDFFLDPSSGKWRWDLWRGDHAFSTMDAEPGQWYYVEALVDFGGPAGTTYTAQVRIDGVDQPTIVSTGQEGSTVRAAWFGGRQSGLTNTRLYDSLGLDVGGSPFDFTR